MIATCHTIEATSPVVDLVRFSSIQVGQADSPAVVNRREAGKWLAYARQAMQTGNFPLAEDYLQRAQRLNPQYDRLTSRFEDTPVKVAADLAKLRNGMRPAGAPVKAATVQRPGITPPTDPYSVGSQQATLERLADQSKAQAVSAMQNARSAMQAGDLAGAIGWYQSAVGAGAKFATNEYQPFHLAQELQKAGVDPKQLTPPVLRTTRMLDPTKLAAMPADRVQAMGGATATGASNNAFRAALVNNPEQLGTAQAVNSDSRAEQGRLPIRLLQFWNARDLTHQFEKGFGVDIFDQHIVQPAGIPPLLIGPDHGIAGVAEGVMPLRRRFVNLLVERLSTLGVRLLAQFLHPEILRFAIRRLQRHAPRGGLGQSRAQGLGRRIGQHVADQIAAEPAWSVHHLGQRAGHQIILCVHDACFSSVGCRCYGDWFRS